LHLRNSNQIKIEILKYILGKEGLILLAFYLENSSIHWNWNWPYFSLVGYPIR